jgi:hypothetical protein
MPSLEAGIPISSITMEALFIQVLIVDERNKVRRGLKMLLEKFQGSRRC